MHGMCKLTVTLCQAWTLLDFVAESHSAISRFGGLLHRQVQTVVNQVNAKSYLTNPAWLPSVVLSALK